MLVINTNQVHLKYLATTLKGLLYESRLCKCSSIQYLLNKMFYHTITFFRVTYGYNEAYGVLSYILHNVPGLVGNQHSI